MSKCDLDLGRKGSSVHLPGHGFEEARPSTALGLERSLGSVDGQEGGSCSLCWAKLNYIGTRELGLSRLFKSHLRSGARGQKEKGVRAAPKLQVGVWRGIQVPQEGISKPSGCPWGQWQEKGDIAGERLHPPIN